MDKQQETSEQIYTSFWKPLVEKDNKLNKKLVASELSNYYTMLQQVPKVYKYITNNNISSPFNDANIIISEANYQYAEDFEESQKDLIEKYLGEKMILSEVLLELLEFRNKQNPNDVRTERLEDTI